jgi:hypothetical protein
MDLVVAVVVYRRRCRCRRARRGLVALVAVVWDVVWKRACLR